MSLVPHLRSELDAGDQQKVLEIFESMQVKAAAARDTATGPLWTAATIIPVVGPNLRAVTEVAVSADDVVSQAVGPLLDKYDFLSGESYLSAEGRFDLAPLREAAPSISAAENTARLSYERLQSLDLRAVVPQVADPIRSATKQLEVLSDVLGTASSAAQLLPSMLGADGPRNYLVLVQNSAETRATGGIPGALAVLTAADGKLTLEEQSSASALGTFRPAVPVELEQTALYTARLGTQMQNVNLTPDFPTAAATAKSMWEVRHGDQTLDGVLALDAVVLRNLIGATGPVDVTDPQTLNLIETTSLPNTLTEDNVVSTLLSDVYREIQDPAVQDAYFSSVAGQVFASFTEGNGDHAGLIRALSASAQEDRLYVWSSRSSEQSIIAATNLAGSVLGMAGDGASFGVYFNDGTGAKMDYYASRTAQLLQTCQADGYSRYTVRMTVTNNAPADAATSLPTYVTGRGVYGVKPGSIRTNYVYYGPAQAFAERATVNGQPVPIGSGKHGQRPVGTVTLELAPGETAELDVVFSHVVQDSDPKLKVTPGLEPIEKVILPAERASCR
ncbi:DUF4012 domain-containing protein [Arthrobacter sp. ZGTC212]|uniref:DUF4012 domain-containing protein n=1 Tax=Arthrobacter sp. ZGTC212 TaxID=2058899 RepID=UPI0021575729|nr:DUF4012 domain-containing protein [Arthrobacter sp. ZGTC212]